MTSVINDIKLRFRQKDILIQLIVINVSVFLLLTVFTLVTKLFKLDTLHIIGYIGVPSDIDLLVKRAWTLVTYMFVHIDFIHILLNMFFLYWFGQIFLRYFNAKNLGSLYVLGGFAGAVLYILAFNSIPYYIDMGSVPMIGASASTTAIMFAAAFYNPKAEVNLFFAWRIKIIYIAIFIFILDFISLGDTSNPGGHVAHIGGAILGYIFARQYQKGKDITRWVTMIIDWGANLFKPKPPKMKVKSKRKESDYEYNERRKNETEEIDHILDKIKISGYSSLTQNEKKRLFDAGKK